MATTIEQLVVSLDADINKLTKQLAKANGSLDEFDREADRQTKRTAQKVAENLGEVAKAVNDNAGLNFQQFQILGHAARAAFDGISAGASPLKTLAQEGVRASAAIGPGGLSGLLGGIASYISPVLAVGAAFTLVGGAALYAGFNAEQAQEKIKLGLSGIGAVSGATVKEIYAIGDAAAATGKITASSAREIAASLAATGKIDKANIPGIVNLTPGYAALFEKDSATAGQDLGRIFADPAKGADELNARLAALDDRTNQYIKTLAAQGDRQQAIQVLIRAVQPDLDRAAEKTTVWAKAWNLVANAADQAGQAVLRAATGPSLETQAKRAEEQRQQLVNTPAVTTPFASINTDIEKDRKKAIDASSASAEHLNEVLRRTGQADFADTQNRQLNVLSEAAGKAVREFDSLGEEIKHVSEQLGQLDRAIGTAGVGDKIEGGLDKAREASEALRGKLALLQEDYAKGGAAATAALRQANFAAQTAGLSSYDKGLREITFRFEELKRAAEASGNTKALPTIDAQQLAELEAYKRNSLERARQSVTVSPEIGNVVIGAEGNNASKNPASSASGYGQFIDSTFLALFKKMFSDQAAQLSDEGILQLKQNRDINVKLIEEYARENAVTLEKAGFDGQKLVNLYLAHFLGPQGAIAALKASPSANAEQVLGAAAAKANPTVIGGGRSIQDVLDFAQRRVQGNSQSGRTQKEAVISEAANAAAYDKSAAQAARLSSIQEQLNADREKGGELGEKYATADALIAAKSSELTPALAAQRTEIIKLADARAKAAASGLSSRFETDLKNSREALGRTTAEQQTYTQAKTYATPGTAEFDTVIEKLTEIQRLNDLKSDGSTFFKGLSADLINGTNAGQALENQLKRLASTLLDKTIDKLFSSLFGSLLGGGSSTGIGSLFGLGGSSSLGFASAATRFAVGGAVTGPGSGTSDSILARLSNGEFVVNAESARRFGPLLDEINRGLPGFAAGGAVGALPTLSLPYIPQARPAASAAPPAQNIFAPVINAQGADRAALQQVQAQLRDLNKTFNTRVAAASRDQDLRKRRPL